MKNWLVVGLGNPEGKYFSTYHNIGFLTAEKFADTLEIKFKKKGNQLIGDAKFDDKKVFVLKPLTYMNNSGQAVTAAARKYKIAPENIIVICDDLYIEKGHIRISNKSSGGGHNGLKSITTILQSNEYINVRIGIMPDDDKIPHAKYVLSKIDKDNMVLINDGINSACNAVTEIISGEKLETVKGKFNVKNATCNACVNKEPNV